MNKMRILVVDDHQLFRKGVVAAIRDERPDWEVCGEASTGREAIAAAEQLKPEIVVMDISMPDMNGLEATRQLLKNHPQMEVMVLSMYESEQIVHDVLNCGARGYILKGDAGTDIIVGLETLGQHRLYFSSKVSEMVMRGYREGPSVNTDAPTGKLSARERQIAQLIAEGQSNKDVANGLNISVKTVETHRARIMAKLDLHSVSDLVRYAVRNNMVVV